ncbi:MAG: hypothetical protein GY822_26905 [Deltaproteobacteria bacterium]|nr:hypothetical protein [Deltaproteobacteria bacterium]
MSANKRAKLFVMVQPLSSRDTRARLSFSGVVLRLTWIFSLVALTMILVAIWRGNLDAEKIKMLFSSLAGSFYLSCALACSAASIRQRLWPVQVILQLGQGIAFLSLGLFLVGIWTQFRDPLTLWRAWAIGTCVTLAFSHSSLLLLARKRSWGSFIEILTAVSSWVLCYFVSWMLWFLCFDNPTIWNIILSCLLFSSAGSASILLNHVASVFASRRERHKERSAEKKNHDDGD